MQQFIEKLSQFAVSSKFIGSIIILALTFLVTKLVSKLFKMLLKKGRVNVTHLTFLRRIVISVLWVLGVSGVLLQFEPFQKFVMSFLASSGILAVILGFAAQEAVGNLVSGMFISLFKPFELGDRIRIPSENIEGFVEDISLRHTVIRTFENSRIIVPNSIMNKAVLENVNFSESKVCNFLDIGISYDSDLDQAIAIIKNEVQKHPDFLDNRREEEKTQGDEPVIVRVTALADSSVNLRASVWSESASKGFAMLCDLRYSIKKQFDTQGVEIPYPHRTVILKNNSLQEP